MVKELILFANPPIEKQPEVNVNQLLEEALLLTFKEIGGEKITIKKKIDKQLPVHHY